MATATQASELTAVSVRDIWKGVEQTYRTYDGRLCTYNMAMLDAVLGEDYATAPIAEKATFIAYCIHSHLDPIRKQVYFIKYQKGEPAGFVTNWEVFLDQAQRHPAFDGYESGIVWAVETEEGVTEISRGSPCDYIQDAKHRVIGGWAIAYRKDRAKPCLVEVPLDEMIGKKRDGSPTKFWGKMLTTMATKTPTARALRNAFPDALSGLYTEEEEEAFAAAQETRLIAGDEITGDALDAVAEQIKDEEAVGDTESAGVPGMVTNGDPEEIERQVDAELEQEQAKAMGDADATAQQEMFD